MIVGVVGAGTMGAAIAQIALQAGHEVLLHDVDASAIERGRGRVEEGLRRLVEKSRLDEPGLRDLLGRLRSAHSLAELADESELVIEAALEELELKRSIFRALDEGSAAGIPLATNTSSLSVTAIAEAAGKAPERVLGLHFFNPAPVMPLVEVVVGERTHAAIVDAAHSFAEGLGKTAVVCRDAPGFIVNRVNRPFTLEALRMLEAGEAAVGEIDAAVEAAGYPMGPFRLMDLVGIDVNYAVARSLYEAFDGAERFRPSPIQEEMVSAGRLGRKAGHGFYSYQGEERRAGTVTPDARSGLEPRQIVERIELRIVNEAYHAAGESVASPPDIDRAMKLGANHPYGPFERARALGLKKVIDALQRLERDHGERFRVAPSLWQVATV